MFWPYDLTWLDFQVTKVRQCQYFSISVGLFYSDFYSGENDTHISIMTLVCGSISSYSYLVTDSLTVVCKREMVLLNVGGWKWYVFIGCPAYAQKLVKSPNIFLTRIWNLCRQQLTFLVKYRIGSHPVIYTGLLWSTLRTRPNFLLFLIYCRQCLRNKVKKLNQFVEINFLSIPIGYLEKKGKMDLKFGFHAILD